MERGPMTEYDIIEAGMGISASRRGTSENGPLQDKQINETEQLAVCFYPYRARFSVLQHRPLFDFLFPWQLDTRK